MPRACSPFYKNSPPAWRKNCFFGACKSFLQRSVVKDDFYAVSPFFRALSTKEVISMPALTTVNAPKVHSKASRQVFHQGVTLIV